MSDFAIYYIQSLVFSPRVEWIQLVFWKGNSHLLMCLLCILMAEQRVGSRNDRNSQTNVKNTAGDRAMNHVSGNPRKYLTLSNHII